MSSRTNRLRRPSVGEYAFGTPDDPTKFRIAVGKSYFYLNVLRLLITAVVVVYSVIVIVTYQEKKDDETRRSLEFTNEVLMGHNGALLMLFWLWISTFIIIAMLPVLLHFLHRLGIVQKQS